MLLSLSLFNMPECPYINRILNMSWVLKYDKILNKANFWIWQVSHYATNKHGSEYARICLDRVLNILGSKYSRILNMVGLHRVLNVSQYDWISLYTMWISGIMSEFTIMDRVLNMYHAIYSAGSLYKLMSTYWEIGMFRTLSECWNMSEFWIFVNFLKFDRVLNMRRDAIMEGLEIFKDSKYTRFLHMQVLHMVLNNALWQGSKYAWSTFHRVLNKFPVLNMPGLRIRQGCEYARIAQGAEYAWICLNKAEFDWLYWKYIS